MEFKPHKYQQIALAHVMKNNHCGLILDMGLGKTVVCETAIMELVYGVEILRPLVIAPKLVTEKTWSDELEKWDHLKGLRLSKIVGSPKQRIAALSASADFWIISRDNIAWLVDHLGSSWDFDMLVIDELSSFKNRSSGRFKAVRKILGRLHRFVGLTGTPAPNGLLDLWSQIYLMDKGERLGKTLGGFRELYFKPDKRNGNIIYSYVLREGAREHIYKMIGDICLSMRAKDWLDLKPREDIIQYIDLPDMAAYKRFEKDAVLAVTGAVDGAITAVNAGALYNKLLQYCNGAVYDESGAYHIIHDVKLDMLQEKIEELNGQPVLVFYEFKSDIERIKARFPGAVHLRGAAEIDSWNRGEIPVMIAHPASTGHGLNLQAGGRYMIWFGYPWSLELYLQAIARLDRQGQQFTVINMGIIARGTLEELLVKARLEQRDLDQQDLIKALR